MQDGLINLPRIVCVSKDLPFLTLSGSQYLKFIKTYVKNNNWYSS